MSIGRTVLFTPGDHPRRIASAFGSRADAVVLDLEDGVGPGARGAARSTVVEALRGTSRAGLFVRINGVGTADHASDLAAIGAVLGRLDGVVLPKVESLDQLVRLDEHLRGLERSAGVPVGSVRVVPVVESAAGALAASEIATGPRVVALMLGVLDLAAELGMSPVAGAGGIDHLRVQIAVASRAAGLGAPIDGPHPDLDDAAGISASSAASRALGYGGRVVLHPSAIDTVDRAYRPTDAEINRATAVLAAVDAVPGVGSLRLPDGTFVDAPVVAQARSLLADVGEVARDHVAAR
ncbi:CoA ester lyase [Nakamurella sp. YIM 132087]|uniref:CoA ester lyase n=1 Tax=Nakamurella alba TaxID=2665158 RepID=A0A7K1FPV4_9ACTN|nr:CoA ester lyase [Nakamurella alba]MTD16175.1 CoA ester lyase [Nakamurella alba]